MSRPSSIAAWSCLALLAPSGCGGELGTGDALVVIQSEESILSGVGAGTGSDEIQDGWTVTFDTYVVSLGRVTLGRSSDPAATRSSDEVVVVDLTTVASGVPLSRFRGLDAVTWDRVSYELVPPAASDTRDPSVEPSVFEAMVANGWTYYIEGVLEEAEIGAGQSCPPGGLCIPASTVAFRLALRAPVRFENCESEGAAQGGFAVPSGAETAQTVTLHGDHIFFDTFPGGAEVVARRAQWLADADVDANGQVDMAELASIGLTSLPSLFPASLYNLSGSPVTPFDSADDWVVGQLSTQGHWNGEGECIWAILP